MNYKERLARLGLCNFETRIVELSSLLRQGDTELEARENNTLANSLTDLLEKAPWKIWMVQHCLNVLKLTLNPCVGFEIRWEHREFRHLNVIPLLKLKDTFVVREQREGENMVVLVFTKAFHISVLCAEVCHWILRI